MDLHGSKSQGAKRLFGLLVTLVVCLGFQRLAPAADYRAVPLTVPAEGRPGFIRLEASACGVLFTNALAEERHLTNQIILNGAGMAAGDVDGDGLCDLYFCSLDRPNALFKNLGGWKFRDVTANAGVACPDQDSTGAALADVDGDGDLDLLVNAIVKGTRCFLNDGTGRFQESPQQPPLNRDRAPMSMALADIDGDGDLDVYLANYRTTTLRDEPNTKFSFKIEDGKARVTSINGLPLTHPRYTNRFKFTITLTASGGNFQHEEQGEPDLLLRNNGRGLFEPVSLTDGLFDDENGQPLTQPLLDWGLSVTFRDLNGDRAPDIWVCNDFKSPDRIWLNDGQGRFRPIADLALRQSTLSSMGLDIADINRDGHDDVFVLDMLSPDRVRRLTQRMELRPEIFPPGSIRNRPQNPRNMLFLNRGDGTYAEIAQMSGVEAADWAWTPPFLDVDLDGYEDILVVNGFERDGMHVDTLMKLDQLKKQTEMPPLEQLRLRRLFPKLMTPNLAFQNQRDLTFIEHGADWAFNTPSLSQGAILADLDNDGDQDVVVCNLNAAPGLYRNENNAPRLVARLRGQPPNTAGVGARILVSGGPVPQSQEIICGARYLATEPMERTFAAGPGPMTIEVLWRSGRRSLVTNALANHLYEIQEPATPVPAPQPAPAPPTPFFKPLDSWPGHQHHETAFNDWERQPMLAHGLSRPGPGVAWFDLDADGREELIVGSGAGGRLAVFHNDGNRKFQAWNQPPFYQPVTRDQTGVLGWSPDSGPTEVLAGSSNYEDGLAQGSVVLRYPRGAKSINASLPGQPSATGPLAMADIDLDGDLDLFVGGRVIPGRYPEPASSLLFLNQAGDFQPDPANQAVLRDIGCVQGAVFSDLDGDGDPDLILATHWGPVRVLRNDAGRFTDQTQALGLHRYSGWWNGVATGDFDGDGRLDILASNWGRNSRYQRYRNPSLLALAGDLDGNGTVEIVEAYQPAPDRPLTPLQPFHIARLGFPMVGTFFTTCDAYSAATLDQIYGPTLQNARRYEANWLETTLFLNRGSTFQPRILPVEAQIAPAFAVCIADLDGDTHEDVFLSQNFFTMHPEMSRYDAGRGLWLRGDGSGGFQPVPGQESGLLIYGEQRGAALCDFDADGKVDLAVCQNGADTLVFRNQKASPGLRIRLRGPQGNPHAVGALLRLKAGTRLGAAREIQAGSGYYSQNSPVVVLTPLPDTTALWIRWPGGKETESALPADAREIVVSQDGGIEVVR